jgi:hypothetical protein
MPLPSLDGFAFVIQLARPQEGIKEHDVWGTLWGLEGYTVSIPGGRSERYLQEMLSKVPCKHKSIKWRHQQVNCQVASHWGTSMDDLVQTLQNIRET